MLAYNNSGVKPLPQMLAYSYIQTVEFGLWQAFQYIEVV